MSTEHSIDEIEVGIDLILKSKSYLCSKVAKLNQQNVVLAKTVAECEMEKRRLTVNRNDLRTQGRLDREENQHLQTRIASLEADCDAKTLNIEVLKGEKNQLLKRLTLKQTANDVFSANNAAHRVEIYTLHNDMEDKNQELCFAKTKAQQLEEDNARLTTAHSNATRQIKGKSIQILDINRQLDDKTQELCSSKATIQQLHEDNKRLSMSQSSLTQQIKDGNVQFIKIQCELGAKNQQLCSAVAKIQQLEEEKKNEILRIEKEKLQLNLVLEEERKNAADQRSASEWQLSNAEEKLRNSIEQAESKQRILEVQITDLRNKVSDFQQVLENESKISLSLRKEELGRIQELKTYKEELENYKLKLAEANSKCTNTQESLNVANFNMQKLTQKYDENNTELKFLNSVARDLQDQNEAEQKKLQDMTERLEECSRSLTAATLKNDQIESELEMTRLHLIQSNALHQTDTAEWKMYKDSLILSNSSMMDELASTNHTVSALREMLEFRDKEATGYLQTISNMNEQIAMLEKNFGEIKKDRDDALERIQCINTENFPLQILALRQENHILEQQKLDQETLYNQRSQALEQALTTCKANGMESRKCLEHKIHENDMAHLSALASFRESMEIKMKRKLLMQKTSTETELLLSKTQHQIDLRAAQRNALNIESQLKKLIEIHERLITFAATDKSTYLSVLTNCQLQIRARDNENAVITSELDHKNRQVLMLQETYNTLSLQMEDAMQEINSLREANSYPLHATQQGFNTDDNHSEPLEEQNTALGNDFTNTKVIPSHVWPSNRVRVYKFFKSFRPLPQECIDPCGRILQLANRKRRKCC